MSRGHSYNTTEVYTHLPLSEYHPAACPGDIQTMIDYCLCHGVLHTMAALLFMLVCYSGNTFVYYTRVLILVDHRVSFQIIYIMTGRWFVVTKEVFYHGNGNTLTINKTVIYWPIQYFHQTCLGMPTNQSCGWLLRDLFSALFKFIN